MSHASGKQPSGDGRWMLFLAFIGGVGGGAVGDIWIRRNEDLIMWAILSGLALSVLGLGYSIVIRNPFRYLLVVLGGFGSGLIARGYLGMM